MRKARRSAVSAPKCAGNARYPRLSAVEDMLTRKRSAFMEGRRVTRVSLLHCRSPVVARSRGILRCSIPSAIE